MAVRRIRGDIHQSNDSSGARVSTVGMSADEVTAHECNSVGYRPFVRTTAPARRTPKATWSVGRTTGAEER
ncbi:hypothetical protein SAMN04487948_105126 [Halogranum amylolyticum]|uniref:Uncharacterized protein n=1 Tax=Halogranum amylolyticum TaxID=660520 RepID=A0A1H8SJ10_9EURY|nr:hypothetical protein [Halogranum amylolyticum]SEO78506.1 hypothetical protein SAMN04487948_105126 [Halogranum amylolyticum]